MKRVSLIISIVVWLLMIPLSRVDAGELPRSAPEEVGLSAEKLAGLKPALQKLVDAGKNPGGVVLIARHGKVAYSATYGYRDLAKKTPMTEDTIFAIASMTKPITCTAVMMLIEQGKLGLDDPVAKFLPELKELRVLGKAEDDTETELATVPAKRPVTVRDLLSHSSGFTYGSFLSTDARLAGAYTRAKVQGQGAALKNIAEQVERLAKVPLAYQPGEGWSYGLSHDVLGRLIEVVSGESFDNYLQKHIFAVLDMPDTSFCVPEAKHDRVATVYRAGEGGVLTPIPRNFGSKTFFSGGGGLYSTARDYSRFAQMYLNGGELEGARIIKPETIALMTTNQIGKYSAFTSKYGLGFGLVFSGGASAKTPVLERYFWGGYFSTNFWIDPRHDLAAVIMTQVLPTNHGGADGVFRNAVAGAIQK
jgi:CubicO group peptidase (beta-lactamase class C family)